MDDGKRERDSGLFVGRKAQVQDEREFFSVAVPGHHPHQCVFSRPCLLPSPGLARRPH